MGQTIAVNPGGEFARTYSLRRRNLPISPGSAGVLAGILLVLMIVGSLADFSLARGVYLPDNPFGVFFAAYGEAPALLALVAAGTLAMAANPPVPQILRWLLLAGGAGLIVVGTIALAIRPEENWESPIALRIVIAVVLSAAAIWGTRRVAAGAAWQAMCVLAAALFVVVAAELVAVQAVKLLWERPRMRMLSETGAPFAPWWSPGYGEKEALLASGVPSSEFKSFPSGHSAHATVAVMLAGFGLLKEDLRASALFWVGGIWALLVALSRLTMGAHFLTDVSAAMLITLVIAVVVSLWALRILESNILDRLVVGTDPPPPRHRTQ